MRFSKIPPPPCGNCGRTTSNASKTTDYRCNKVVFSNTEKLFLQNRDTLGTTEKEISKTAKKFFKNENKCSETRPTWMPRTTLTSRPVVSRRAFAGGQGHVTSLFCWKSVWGPGIMLLLKANGVSELSRSPGWDSEDATPHTPQVLGAKGKSGLFWIGPGWGPDGFSFLHRLIVLASKLGHLGFKNRDPFF